MPNPIRPYKVWVYNRITGQQIGQYYTNQVPTRGDHLTLFPQHTTTGRDAFHLWGQWTVDLVSWQVAQAASVTAFEVAKETGGDMGAAYCELVELHCWPTQGPHWTEQPRFAAVLAPDDDYDPADIRPLTASEAAEAVNIFTSEGPLAAQAYVFEHMTGQTLSGEKTPSPTPPKTYRPGVATPEERAYGE